MIASEEQNNIEGSRNGIEKPKNINEELKLEIRFKT